MNVNGLDDRQLYLIGLKIRVRRQDVKHFVSQFVPQQLQVPTSNLLVGGN